MEKIEFKQLRKRLGKTQKQIANLLGVSLKTIYGYEQGWRRIPPHIERYLFFLVVNQRKVNNKLVPCWEQNDCLQKEGCAAWEFQVGHLCWFMCGTLSECTSQTVSKVKLDNCRSCYIFKSLINSQYAG